MLDVCCRQVLSLRAGFIASCAVPAGVRRSTVGHSGGLLLPCATSSHNSLMTADPDSM